MPTMTLVPDGISGEGSGIWEANSGTRTRAVETNNGDTTYISEGNNGDNVTFSFPNPSVAEADIRSITSIQLFAYGRLPARGSSGADVQFTYDSVPSATGLETINFPNSAVYALRNGTANTVNSDGSAFTYDNLEDIILKVNKSGVSGAVRITQIGITVTYVEEPDTGDSIFFGTNF